MRLERDIVEGVHRIEDAYVNWYLVEDGDELTIVDTGHPRSWGSLQQALPQVGRRPEEIGAVVLTHGHFDHMGFAQRARDELGVAVLAPAGDVGVVAHPWRYRHEHSRALQAVRHPSFVRVFAEMGAAGALFVSGVEHPVTFEPGDELDVAGRPLVLATPGHTDGHCSLLFPGRGLVIAGDALVTFNPYTGGEGPQIVSGAATADSRRALASLDAIAASHVDTIAPGHGEPWRGDPALAVAQARAVGPS